MWRDLPHIARILVPVDLTDASLCGVEAALALSRDRKSQIYLIHVVASPPPPSAGGATGGQDRAIPRGESLAMEEFFLTKVRSQSRIACIVRSGEVAGEVLTFAREEGIDVIVLPVGLVRGEDPLRPGGIAECIIRHAAVPVLVVRPRPSTGGTAAHGRFNLAAGQQ